jgi:hypothetical protein
MMFIRQVFGMVVGIVLTTFILRAMYETLSFCPG